nr:HAMP domain-containing sensor histidine kinase [Alteromonas profundi]
MFWRIFLTFWLASLLVMAATGYVLVSKYSSDEYNQRYFNDVLSQAERIVWRYEQDLSNGNVPKGKIKEWIGRNVKKRSDLIPMQIVDNTGRTIYHFRMNKVKPRDRTERLVYGLSALPYRVEIRLPEAPRIFKQVLYRFQSLQFVFIFIASALVSALLSWGIVRPINYLGAFSRRYANQQQVAAPPKAMLARGDELGDLAADISFMINKTHQAASNQQQLLHDVSHELRAPLARLQASAAIIEQHNPESRHVKQIHSDCERMSALIQQILNYSKLEKVNPVVEMCNVNRLCERVADDMAVHYPSIPIEFNGYPNAEISGYPEALHQALENIIGNACKYSPRGEPVELSTQKQGNTVIISVRDHGPGVKEDEMEKLLQPFYRAGNQMHTSGFGLGLSIAKKAIEKHGGTLRMHSPTDGGLLVEMVLPIHQQK